ncbi:MAG TPA: hypothetical protein PKY12_12690, partial [Catalimonadaceae bacterium]|nr:hypothetical protein [Catalimonadaceae bacterium]
MKKLYLSPTHERPNSSARRSLLEGKGMAFPRSRFWQLIPVLAFFLFSGQSMVWAQTIQWTNTGTSTAWYTAGNWTPSTAAGAWV